MTAAQSLIQRLDVVPEPWGDPVLSAVGMADMLRLGNVFLWAYIENGQSSGSSLGHVAVRSDGEDWEILTLWVQVEARRRGVARGLLRSIILAAMDEKAHKIFLDVRPSNMPAVALYEKLGFRQIATRLGYYSAPREDAAVYALELK